LLGLAVTVIKKILTMPIFNCQKQIEKLFVDRR
jgi:hypothetical protein